MLGMQAALTVTMQRSTDSVMVAVGQQKCVDKAAAGFVGFAIPAPGSCCSLPELEPSVRLDLPIK